MTENNKYKFSAYLGISPIESLSRTADVLSEQLGIKFDEDESGFYQEFPAYCTFALGVKFALLGIPEEGITVSGEPIDFYELQLVTLISGDRTEVDMSEYLVDLLDGKNGIKCWKLE